MRKIITLTFEEGFKHIEEGDVLFFRSTSLISLIIRKVGFGIYSHVALASWRGEPHKSLLECVEFKENKGGRTVSLNIALDASSTVDVYRPIPKYEYYQMTDVGPKLFTIIYNGAATTDFMRFLTGLEYGWKRILIMSRRHIPFFRWFVTFIDDESESTSYVYPVCSTSIARAFRKTYTDPVPLMSDAYVEPNDLARSPLFTYLFTIKGQPYENSNIVM